MTIRCRVIEKDYFLRASREFLSNMRVDPAFPVTMAKRGGRRRDRQLMGDEVIVCDSVRCEMCEITKTERTHRLRTGLVINLETDIPGMAVATGSCVFLGDAGVGRNASVKEIVRKGGDDLGDR